MSTEGTTAATTSCPPYIKTVGGDVEEVKVYHLHTVFNPPTSATEEDIFKVQAPVPVYRSSPPTYKFVSYETVPGRSPGVTTCTSCQQQVMTNVTHKAGAFAWLMCFVFIFCGLFFGCCLIPFFAKRFKDVYHSCPRCNRILHVERSSCC
ncbi:lipopolysaccharide-induced tumor necrosis factor-alpha factor homolog isoform X2 [Anguilla rostrata]